MVWFHSYRYTVLIRFKKAYIRARHRFLYSPAGCCQVLFFKQLHTKIRAGARASSRAKRQKTRLWDRHIVQMKRAAKVLRRKRGPSLASPSMENPWLRESLPLPTVFAIVSTTFSNLAHTSLQPRGHLNPHLRLPRPHLRHLRRPPLPSAGARTLDRSPGANRSSSKACIRSHRLPARQTQASPAPSAAG